MAQGPGRCSHTGRGLLMQRHSKWRCYACEEAQESPETYGEYHIVDRFRSSKHLVAGSSPAGGATPMILGTPWASTTARTFSTSCSHRPALERRGTVHRLTAFGARLDSCRGHGCGCSRLASGLLGLLTAIRHMGLRSEVSRSLPRMRLPPPARRCAGRRRPRPRLHGVDGGLGPQ